MKSPTIEFDLHIERRGHGARKVLREGKAAKQPEPGRVPRISRLMALAIKFEKMIASGKVRDYAEIARLGRVTRARVSQVASLTCLAPDIQEAILSLPVVEDGRDPIVLRDLLPIAMELEWKKQRTLWSKTANQALNRGGKNYEAGL
jgi:hypothetical protein